MKSSLSNVKQIKIKQPWREINVKDFLQKKKLSEPYTLYKCKNLEDQSEKIFFVGKVTKEREKVKKGIETKVWAFQMIETPISF